ncbi:type II secretion system F family protein [Corynebacterium sp.]|uniref:type II secretion system F family protein n=1 Tax=Corynebacterium sp. TaxID=1720 RepID=UPI0026DDBF06|nr:type II secretion system F family protein [Corynebacterium sp.]MDO4609524.1 type II secretion system F family protein [Corynebacterium sp.]
MTAALLLLAAALLIPESVPPRRRLPGLLPGRWAGADGGARAEREGNAAGAPILARLRARIVGTPPPRALAAAAALDLVAACLRAGLPPATAIGAVAQVAGDLADPLRGAAARLSLGAPDPWAPLAECPEFADAARLARRASESGTSLAEGLADLADRHRRRAGDAAEASAERAGVLISGPLALCFLPAFVALGLVPVIAGLAGRMLSGGLP